MSALFPSFKSVNCWGFNMNIDLVLTMLLVFFAAYYVASKLMTKKGCGGCKNKCAGNESCTSMAELGGSLARVQSNKY